MDLVFERRHRVASYHAGPNGAARPSALMGFMEDAAGEHAASWRLGFADLFSRGFAWVLTRYHLRLLRSPRVGEELLVRTWPSGRAERVALRDFEVSGPDGEPVALATTAWKVLDLAARRPRPIDDVVPAGFVLDRRALPDDFPRLPAPAAPGREVALPVMLRDLDMNRHVNHVVYLQWALEALPVELLARALPGDIEVAYLAEAGLGDRIISASARLDDHGAGPAFAHLITHADSGRELARLRTGWRD